MVYNHHNSLVVVDFLTHVIYGKKQSLNIFFSFHSVRDPNTKC